MWLMATYLPLKSLAVGLIVGTKFVGGGGIGGLNPSGAGNVSGGGNSVVQPPMITAAKTKNTPARIRLFMRNSFIDARNNLLRPLNSCKPYRGGGIADGAIPRILGSLCII